MSSKKAKANAHVLSKYCDEDGAVDKGVKDLLDKSDEY